ncbi:MAG: hypothetical protein IBX55_08905 [Methyloprofundus sp.]|nr:hypothetical protein [Methyloprofundus sp.]
MKNRIIYKTKDNTVAIIIPVEDVLDVVGLAAIAEKDVPQNLPYWFADLSDIPSDRTARDAWEVDETLGEPEGFGGESNEFTDEQLLALYQQGVVGDIPNEEV